MKPFLLLLAFAGLTQAQIKTQNEPTNAAEAAAKKAADEEAVDERYQAWKAKLPADQQAWESVLEQCLGGFYLPIHKKEKITGHSNAWDFVQDDPKLPRVLLIGDSISRGYTQAVRKAMAGKANVHRAPENCGPTANGVKKIEIWLGDGKWDVIHFNFGIHDRATPEAEYEHRLGQIIARLQATGAKLVWANSTPLPDQSSYGSDAAIVTRNEIAARVVRQHSIPINDLYAYIHPRLADYQKPNDVHFSDVGYSFLGQQVAREVVTALDRSAVR